MSAIGDYIHATSLGYSGYGVPKGPFYDEGVKQIIRDRENKLMQWNAQRVIPPRVKEELQNAIEGEIELLDSFSKADNDSEENKMAEAFFEDFVEELEKEFSAGINRMDINAYKQSGNIIQGAQSWVAAQDAYYASEHWINEATVKTKELITEIDMTLQKIAQNDNLTLSRIQERIGHLQGRENELVAALQSANWVQGKSKRLTSIVNTYLAEIKKYMGNNKILKKGQANQKVNKLIKDYVSAIRKKDLSSNLSGATGEILTKLASAKIDSIAKGNIKNMMSNIIGSVSSQRLVANMSTEFVDVEDLSNGKYKIFDDKTGMITANAASEKIDVEIYLKDQREAGIYASVKNYSTATLETASFKSQNALSLLWNENGDNLINHYLTLCSVKYTGKHTNLWDSNRRDIIQYIRKLLIQKLISGQGTAIRSSKGDSIRGMSSANVFVAINSDTHKVKIISIGDMLEKIQQDERYVNYDKLLPEIKEIDNYLGYSSAKARITDILRPLMQPAYLEVDINNDF